MDNKPFSMSVLSRRSNIIDHQSLLALATDDRKGFSQSTDRKILLLVIYYSHFFILIGRLLK